MPPVVPDEIPETTPDPVVPPVKPVAQTATEEKKRMFNEKVKKLCTQRFLPKSITADEVKELFDLWHDGVIDGKNADAVADVLKTVILNGVFKNEPKTLKDYITQFITACPNDKQEAVAEVLTAAIESDKFDENWLNVRISEFINAYDKNDDDDHNLTIVLILTKAIEKDLDIKYLGNLKNRIPKFITFCLNKKEDIAANASLITGVLSVAIKNNLLNQELHSQVQQIYAKLEQRRLYFIDNEEQIRIKEWLNTYKTTV